MKKTPILALFSAVLFLTGNLQAAQIQGVTINAVSGQYSNLGTSNPDRRGATNLVGTTGLFGDMVNTVPGGSMWLSATAGSVGTNFVVFDLGAVHTVNAIKVWNYNENGYAYRGIKTASISYSPDGVTFTTNQSNPGISTNYTFNEAPNAFGAFGQTITSDLGFSARYVRIDVVTNWYTAANYVGLSKVRFVDNTVPPTILSATENFGSNQVTVYFSESVDPTSATTLANYSITSGAGNATIVSAAMGAFNDRVVLQTSRLTNQNYSLVASGVYDLALTATITNTTMPVMPELIVWLDANTGVVTDGSGNVTNWVDRSVYGHNAMTATVNTYTAPPTLASGVVNGLPAVSFATGQLMKIPNDANLAINGDVTVCVVLDKTTSAAGDVISKTAGQGNPYTGTPPHGYTNNMPAPFDYQITAAQKSSWVWGNAGTGTTYGSLSSSGAFVINQYYIVTAVVTQGTNFSWYLNGAVNGTTVFPEAPADGGTPIMLGVRADSGNPGDTGLTFAGNLAEVMVIRGTVTPADLVAMNNYLGTKYGIPITHLAITEQPASTTATNGQTATFWVNAVGIPPLTYQWYTNNGATNSKVSGATSAVYTTPPVTATYNNLNYSVVVTTPVGAITSSPPAVLTVVADTQPPTVFSATKSATNATNIVVVYSEAVSNATALNTASYLLNGVAPLSAVAGSQSNVVILTASAALSTNTTYILTIQNVKDLFANTIVTTNILVLPSGMSLWLRADVGVVTDTNGNVVQWLDQTVNTNNATQYSGGPSARPTPQSNQMNGEPALLFNAGSSNYLQAASTPSLAITNDISIYIVANIADTNAAREFLGKTGGTAGNYPAPYDFYDSGTTRFFWGNGSSYAYNIATMAPTLGVPHVLALTKQGTNFSNFLDGNANGTGILATNGADTGNPLRIGTRYDFAQFMNGDIAEVMIFSNALSSTDRINIDNYLGIKYFPFTITQQPADVSTNEGVTATFSVVASQGSAHFNYQWQEGTTNNPTATNIANATNASYTTGILSPGDNGDTFVVQITTPGISANYTNYSNPATLTVNNVPPVVVSAGIAIWNQSQIVVIFTEAVDPTTGTNPNNYSLNPADAGVLSAAIGDIPNKVILATSPLTPGMAYSVTVSNVMDLFGNTMVAAATPVGVYPARVALWLEANRGVTTDGGGYVTEWDDQSGNANNMFQPGGDAYAPLLVPNAINGMPALYFEATNLYNYMYAQPSASLAITGDMSVFAVMNFNSLNASGSTIVSKATVSLPSPYDYYVRSTAVQFYRGNGSVYGLVNGTSVPSTGVPHLLGVLMQGTGVLHRLDGTVNGTGTLSTTIADNPAQYVYIGARDDGTNQFNGQLAEMIVLGATASTNDTVAIEKYLGAKYGLSVAPTITQQPVAATNADQNGTLVVPAAVAGASPMFLQWYDTNNVAVPGQTNATLVISNISANDSYYLYASNAFGSANSTTVAVTLVSGLTVNPLTPASLTTFAGSIMTYAVTAIGTAPMSYQWFTDDTPVANATNSTYALVVQPGTNTYSCTVSNAYNGGTSASSGDATLIGLSPATNLYTLTVLSNNPIAYWRLDEASGSAIAHDQIGGHNASYTNVLLGVPGFDPTLNPDTAAEFGLLATSNSFAGEIDNSANAVPNIDFSQPPGGNAELSVEAWVKSTNAQVSGAGIVTKGYGSGGEQFDLDLYGGDFRFFVRDTSGTVHGPTSSVVPATGQWYHVVGVWDGANGAARLYIDGAQSAAITNIATGLGLQAAPNGVGVSGANLVSIGARTSASNSISFSLQFQGVIDEVALYNYALSPSQVQADYQIGSLLLPPTLTIANVGGGQVQLSWDAGILQNATNVAGPYNSLTNAASPYTIPASNGQQFFRVLDN